MKRPSLVLMLDVLLLIIVIMMKQPHNPEMDVTTQPPGMVIVEIRWPDDLNTDVDLWVRAPGDSPVGYSNRAGTIFNLLRDDLGLVRDTLSLNYENSYSRGAPPGEYIVNIHLYNDIARAAPIDVIVTASVRANGGTTHIFTKTVRLSVMGQEVTVNRFTLNDRGVLVKGSTHDMPIALRPASSRGPGW
jgi:hypothetical protein